MQLINEGVKSQSGENDGAITIDGGDDREMERRNEKMMQGKPNLNPIWTSYTISSSFNG